MRGGHVTVVQWLLSMGLDINQRTHGGTGGAPLWWAKKAHGEKHQIVKFLRKNEAKEISPAFI